MKVALSEILWTAANEHLWNGSDWFGKVNSYSCHAVLEALHYEDDSSLIAMQFLKDLGCDPRYSYGFRTRIDSVRQGRRYMWLLLAAKVAEDENIYVEVTQ